MTFEGVEPRRNLALRDSLPASPVGSRRRAVPAPPAALAVSRRTAQGSEERADGRRVVAHGLRVVEAEDLARTYRRGRELVRALDGVTLSVSEGEFVAVTGPSGAGKSTLLHLLGCMDVPTGGRLRLAGNCTNGLSDRKLTRLRREQVGFVFQHFGLIPTLTVRENVLLPALFARRKAAVDADELLERVGIAHRARHRPHELSGGEMQRAAIARALINSPRLLLADEPTGNLDSANGDAIIELFKQLNRDGLTVIVVTHNALLANAARRQVALRDGRLASARSHEAVISLPEDTLTHRGPTTLSISGGVPANGT